MSIVDIILFVCLSRPIPNLQIMLHHVDNKCHMEIVNGNYFKDLLVRRQFGRGLQVHFLNLWAEKSLLIYNFFVGFFWRFMWRINYLGTTFSVLFFFFFGPQLL